MRQKVLVTDPISTPAEIDSLRLLAFLIFGNVSTGSRVLVVASELSREDFSSGVFDITLDAIQPDELIGNAAAKVDGRRELYDIVLVVDDGRLPSSLARVARGCTSSNGSLLWLYQQRRWVILGLLGLADAAIGGRRHVQSKKTTLFAVQPSNLNPTNLFELTFRAMLRLLLETGVREVASLLRRPQQTIELVLPAASPTLVGRTLRALIPGYDSSSDAAFARVRSIYVSSTDVLILKVVHKARAYYVRFPLTQAAHERVAISAGICETLHSRGLHSVPRPLGSGLRGPLCFAETGVAGRGVSRRFARGSLRQAAMFFEIALTSIAEIHLEFAQRRTFSQVERSSHIDSKAAFVNDRLPGGDCTEAFAEVTGKIAGALLSTRVLVTLCHGDLKISNCLFTRSGTRANLVDWDLASHEDLALIDVASLLARSIRQRQGRSLSELIQEARCPIPELFGLCESFFGQCGVDEVDYQTLMLIYWLDRVYKQFRFNEHVSHQWIDDNVMPVLSYVSRSHIAGSLRRHPEESEV